MDQTVVLRLPEQMVERFRRGAAAANKRLEDFLVDRLRDAVPPVDGDLPSPLREELQGMEDLDDDALWQVARSSLPAGRQRKYEELLRKSSEGSLRPGEDATLQSLGEEARRLMLRKSHAYLLLKWRGHVIPSRKGEPLRTREEVKRRAIAAIGSAHADVADLSTRHCAHFAEVDPEG